MVVEGVEPFFVELQWSEGFVWVWGGDFLDSVGRCGSGTVFQFPHNQVLAEVVQVVESWHIGTSMWGRAGWSQYMLLGEEVEADCIP
jgi:hypothetical protein